MIVRIIPFALLFALCLGGLEPECPFGSPLVRLADAEGRCERYWECEDGMISDVFCPSGEGFDPQTQKCSLSAACVAKPTANGLSGIVELLSPKSFRSGFPSFPDMIQLGSKLLSPIFGGLFNKN